MYIKYRGTAFKPLFQGLMEIGELHFQDLLEAHRHITPPVDFSTQVGMYGKAPC